MGKGTWHGLVLLAAAWVLMLVPVPAFPSASAPPPQSVPPGGHERRPRTLTTQEVRQQIERNLKSEPALAGATISVVVDEDRVVLRGGIYSEQQHDLALRIAESYAGNRRIVDRITLRQRTSMPVD